MLAGVGTAQQLDQRLIASEEERAVVLPTLASLPLESERLRLDFEPRRKLV
jgi:hypothetical protein|eukprot:COSAG06_NODE_6646_length_2841_cov_1.693654_3_plen_51_part_00